MVIEILTLPLEMYSISNIKENLVQRFVNQKGVLQDGLCMDITMIYIVCTDWSDLAHRWMHWISVSIGVVASVIISVFSFHALSYFSFLPVSQEHPTFLQGITITSNLLLSASKISLPIISSAGAGAGVGLVCFSLL
jgi:hypothetical protein